VHQGTTWKCWNFPQLLTGTIYTHITPIYTHISLFYQHFIFNNTMVNREWFAKVSASPRASSRTSPLLPWSMLLLKCQWNISLLNQSRCLNQHQCQLRARYRRRRYAFVSTQPNLSGMFYLCLSPRLPSSLFISPSSSHLSLTSSIYISSLTLLYIFLSLLLSLSHAGSSAKTYSSAIKDRSHAEVYVVG